MRSIRLSTVVLVALSVAVPMPLVTAEAVPLPTSRPLADNAPDASGPGKPTDTFVAVPMPKPEPGKVDDVAAIIPVPPTEVLPPNGLSSDAILRSVVEDAADAKRCQAELKALGVKFTQSDPIIEDGGCGIAHPVAVTALGSGVSLSTTATLSCSMAVNVAKWVKEAVDPLAELYLQGDLTVLGVSTSYQCRTRNGVTSAKLSEHSFANGLDVHFFETDASDRVTVRERDDDSGKAALFQAAARGAACAYFRTVLGPMTNPAHSDHFHLDMRMRNGDYRLCE